MEYRDNAPFVTGGDLDAKSITEQDGDLIFEGLAAPTTADDQEEAFEEKALSSAIAEFMAGDRPLLYNHGGLALGNVEHLEHRKGLGLWMRARLVRPEPNTEAADVFNKVKRGVIRGISTAGRFYRRPVAVGDGVKSDDPFAEKFKIYKARFREISLTPIPVHRDALGAVAQKSFAEDEAKHSNEALDHAATAYAAAIERLEAAYAARPAAAGEPCD